MMIKKTNGHLQLLQEQYDKACNDWLQALADMWEWDCKSYGFWIAEEVGGVYCYGDCIHIGIDEIIYCVKNMISEETFIEWTDYVVWASEYGQTTPSFRAWCEGCPRVDKETQAKLTQMKKDLIALCEETKEKISNGCS